MPDDAHLPDEQGAVGFETFGLCAAAGAGDCRRGCNDPQGWACGVFRELNPAPVAGIED